MKQKIRAFVAVDIEKAVRKEATEVIRGLSTVEADVRWIEPENLHLTLKFLEEVPSVEVHEICRAVQEAVADMPPFVYEVAGVGAFPDVNRPRTIWLGAGEGEEALGELAERIETAMEGLDYRREARRFKAHLTIGRARRGERPSTALAEEIRQLADLPIGRIPVGEVIVYSSELTRSGPVYTILGRAPLKG